MQPLQSKLYVAFDMSGILWTALRGGTDVEGIRTTWEGKPMVIPTAEFGYEKAMKHMVDTVRGLDITPSSVILVTEGMSSKSLRLSMYNKYKGGGSPSRPPEAYEQFTKLRDMLVSIWRGMGALHLQQDFTEADDVMAWLAMHTKNPLVIDTVDNDLLVLSGVNKHGATISVRVSGVFDHNPYVGDDCPPFDLKYITLYKAMVGDTSDKIPGIPGFGKKAWAALVTRFGATGLEYLYNLTDTNRLVELEEDAEKDKFIARIFEGREDMAMCWRLAKLYPFYVNTPNNRLQMYPGLLNGRCDDSRVAQWQPRRKLITADNWNGFVPWFFEHAKAEAWLAFDIETSTDDESDDWLAAQGDEDGVDVMGSRLTGMSLTFGLNHRFTVYISINHAETPNVPLDQIQSFLEQIKQQLVIHNTMFEGAVLFNHFGDDWKDNGYNGFLPNWLDTRLEASYVDENFFLDLKKLAKRWFDYDQVEYTSVTERVYEIGAMERGTLLRYVQHELTPQVVEMDEDGDLVVTAEATYEDRELRRFKMCDLTAREAFDYACDDTVVTASLHNFFYWFMMMEGSFGIYLDVEIDASYLHAQSFVHGTNIDAAKLAELVAEDKLVLENAKPALDAFLVANEWEGTVCPVFENIDAASMKYVYTLLTGKTMQTMMRTPSKLVAFIRESDPTVAQMFDHALSSPDGVALLNSWVRGNFKGAPELNLGSPKQLARLLYDVIKAPVRVFNKPTPVMRKAGIRQGSPKTDTLAMKYALMEESVSAEAKKALEAIRVIKMVETRQSLFYKKYPGFVHWQTGRVHSYHNQCGTNTRRGSSSAPNVQQLSKHAKVDGFSPRVREMFIPHKRNAVIVSMDFAAQELRVIAEYSQDENMLACFVGEQKKDMHCLTAVGIARNRMPSVDWSYELFMEAYHSKDHEHFKFSKTCRALAKTTNFSSEYGAMAEKMAAVLMVPPTEAQAYLDAKEEAFPRASEWKKEVVAEAKANGVVYTMLGAPRHLAEALYGDDFIAANKAERQAVNFKVQGSSAEMTKLAEGRMWSQRLEQRFDCEIIGPVHDEVVFSVTYDDLYEFCVAAHACMVAPYANMKVPIESSISFGPNFGVQYEIGDRPTKDAILDGVNQMRKAGHVAVQQVPAWMQHLWNETEVETAVSL